MQCYSDVVIYLDSNATTQVHPQVLEAMLPYLSDVYFNPSSGYRAGKKVKDALAEARAQLAECIGADVDEVLFTGCGTESNSMALRSLATLSSGKKIITGAIEHSAVLRVCEDLAEGEGFEVLALGVDAFGVYDLKQLEEWLSGGDVAFVSLMLTNNETGVIQPIKEAASLSKAAGVPMHTDAIQSIGKMSVDVKDLDVDFLSISGHKFHAPKGVGALYAKRNIRLKPLLLGGGQEKGRRSGTENVASIIAMGKAASIMKDYLADECQHNKTAQLRDLLFELISAELEGVHLNGHPDQRAGNTLHVSFDRCEAAGLLILLDEYGVACSAGSACMTGKQQASHVQKAMGFTDARANSSLRLSLSIFTTEEEIRTAATKIVKAVQKLRKVQGGSGVGPVVVYT